MSHELRIDKWLWAVRLFKTRTIAVEACKKGRVSVQGRTVKPSFCVKVGDVVDVRKPPVLYSFEVVGLTDKRVGAKLVPEFLKDVTSPEQREILELSRLSGFVNRARGMGRPTKKEGRALKSFVESNFDDDDFDFDFDFDSDDSENE